MSRYEFLDSVTYYEYAFSTLKELAEYLTEKPRGVRADDVISHRAEDGNAYALSSKEHTELCSYLPEDYYQSRRENLSSACGHLHSNKRNEL